VIESKGRIPKRVGICPTKPPVKVVDFHALCNPEIGQKLGLDDIVLLLYYFTKHNLAYHHNKEI
jgi:hypothetical protein